MYKPLIALALLLAVVSALTNQATPTSTPSRPDCWTCPPNYVHWWETGMDDSDNGEICQCVKPSEIDDHGCRYCPAGFIHHYDDPVPQGVNRCECYEDPNYVPPTTTTTEAPTTTTTTAAPTTSTTSAPTLATTIKATTTTKIPTKAPVTTAAPGTNQNGDNNARSSSNSLTASMFQLVGTLLVAILAVFM